MQTEQETQEKRNFIREHLQSGDVTGWFDELYKQADGDGTTIPWAQLKPRPAFAEWLEKVGIEGTGKRAAVIGCGLGDDAEALASYGFDVTAFDIAPTAIAWCQERFPESKVHYQVADLFNPPAEWLGNFDFIFECYTVQALPIDIRSKVVGHVVDLVAPNGTLVVITIGIDETDKRSGPPWPLIRSEVNYFSDHGLHEVEFEQLPKRTAEGRALWRVEYHKQP